MPYMVIWLVIFIVTIKGSIIISKLQNISQGLDRISDLLKVHLWRRWPSCLACSKLAALSNLPAQRNSVTGRNNFEARDTSTSLPILGSISFPGLVFSWGEKQSLPLYLLTPLVYRTSVSHSWHFPLAPSQMYCHKITTEGRGGEQSGSHLYLQACFTIKHFKCLSAWPINERFLEEVDCITSFCTRSQVSITIKMCLCI